MKPLVTQGFASFNAVLNAAREAARSASSAADVANAIVTVIGAGQEKSLPIERLLATAAQYVPTREIPDGASCVAQFLRDGAGASPHIRIQTDRMPVCVFPYGICCSSLADAGRTIA